MSLIIKNAQEEDFKGWFELRQMLWPHCSEPEHRKEIATDFEDSTKACLIALKEGKAVGLVELSLRSVVDGCETSPVAYLEGWFVHPDFRKQGIGKALMNKTEEWGRELGCKEMGSDSELDNELSIKLHKHLGFEEVDRVVQFKKVL